MRNITSDQDCAVLDANIHALLAERLFDSGQGVSVNEIQDALGDAAVLRSGILVARGRLRILEGGGDVPYVLTLP